MCLKLPGKANKILKGAFRAAIRAKLFSNFGLGIRILNEIARALDQFPIRRQIAKTEVRRASLLLAEQFAWSAQFQIRLRNLKTIVGFLQHLQPRLRLLIFRRRNQNAK